MLGPLCFQCSLHNSDTSSKGTKMKIGIVGAGNIGGALTRLFRAAGHEVTIANSRGPQSLADLSADTGARAAVIEDAVRGQEVVVVALPMNKIPSLPRELFASTPADVVVVDTSNYYPQQRDGRLDGIEDGSTESEWVEQHLGRAVIKAFNTIEATHLQPGARPAGSTDRIALAVAVDDDRTKSKAMALIDEIGFDAVDAGTIAESWRQQPGSPGYLKDFDVKGLRTALAKASPERQPEWSVTPNSPGTYSSPA
ncbi:NADPH-dependent F420 reductase [Rhizobium ruizarguesonis]|nr:NADPH-dependent F420 reductase [Rhizobium ruizarguesonis]